MEAFASASRIRKIAMLGNYEPRQCGIATFTTHLSDAIVNARPEVECTVLAMNEPGKRHDYPARVGFELSQNEVRSYRRAADYLNEAQVDVLSLQHEYGIFGGPAGAHLLTFLRELQMPIVTTLHTILAEPSAEQRTVMDELVRISQRLIVMSTQGARLLREVHGVPAEKIDLIHHGIPDVPPAELSKAELGLMGKSVLMTFGLLSPDKGIENVIDAMPSILASYPNVVYIVLGATHPHIREHHGEAYREALEERARTLGVEQSVIFHDRFVSQNELTQFLSAADIYITPYLKPEQITSGTLAYAVGSGKAVVSTPYWYATELLDEGRGVLVPWRNPEAISTAINGLLGDDQGRLTMCERARDFGQQMRWPVVATQYFSSFDRALRSSPARARPVRKPDSIIPRPRELPELNLTYLTLMTDSTGLLQHGVMNVPRYEDGYCIDDNARALMLMASLEETGREDADTIRSLSARYLAFVHYAFNGKLGRFRNFMSYSRQFLEECGSEDSHARTLWALGTVVARGRDPAKKSLSAELFRNALPVVANFTSPRAWAYTLLGIDEYLRVQGDHATAHLRDLLANKLTDLYRRTSTPDWLWFEDRLTYANARLPQALIRTGAATRDDEMLSMGMRTLDWLQSIQITDDGTFSPVGCDGFYVRGGVKADFDQQPIEACATVCACLDASRATGETRFRAHARRAFNWFLGQNLLQVPLFDAATGGCCDGLHADRRNENQGAESTLSFLTALSEMRGAERVVVTRQRTADARV